MIFCLVLGQRCTYMYLTTQYFAFIVMNNIIILSLTNYLSCRVSFEDRILYALFICVQNYIWLVLCNLRNLSSASNNVFNGEGSSTYKNGSVCTKLHYYSMNVSLFSKWSILRPKTELCEFNIFYLLAYMLDFRLDTFKTQS